MHLKRVRYDFTKRHVGRKPGDRRGRLRKYLAKQGLLVRRMGMRLYG